jgi:hypothetical protein
VLCTPFIFGYSDPQKRFLQTKKKGRSVPCRTCQSLVNSGGGGLGVPTHSGFNPSGLDVKLQHSKFKPRGKHLGVILGHGNPVPILPLDLDMGSFRIKKSGRNCHTEREPTTHTTQQKQQPPERERRERRSDKYSYDLPWFLGCPTIIQYI